MARASSSVIARKVNAMGGPAGHPQHCSATTRPAFALILPQPKPRRASRRGSALSRDFGRQVTVLIAAPATLSGHPAGPCRGRTTAPILHTLYPLPRRVARAAVAGGRDHHRRPAGRAPGLQVCGLRRRRRTWRRPGQAPLHQGPGPVCDNACRLRRHWCCRCQAMPATGVVAADATDGGYRKHSERRVGWLAADPLVGGN